MHRASIVTSAPADSDGRVTRPMAARRAAGPPSSTAPSSTAPSSTAPFFRTRTATSLVQGHGHRSSRPVPHPQAFPARRPPPTLTSRHCVLVHDLDAPTQLFGTHRLAQTLLLPDANRTGRFARACTSATVSPRRGVAEDMGGLPSIPTPTTMVPPRFVKAFRIQSLETTVPATAVGDTLCHDLTSTRRRIFTARAESTVQGARLTQRAAMLSQARTLKSQSNLLFHRQTAGYMLSGRMVAPRNRTALNREELLQLERASFSAAPELYAGRNTEADANPVRMRVGYQRSPQQIEEDAAKGLQTFAATVEVLGSVVDEAVIASIEAGAGHNGIAAATDVTADAIATVAAAGADTDVDTNADTDAEEEDESDGGGEEELPTHVLGGWRGTVMEDPSVDQPFGDDACKLVLVDPSPVSDDHVQRSEESALNDAPPAAAESAGDAAVIHAPASVRPDDRVFNDEANGEEIFVV